MDPSRSVPLSSSVLARSKIDQFMSLTAQSEDVATRYLEMGLGDVETALEYFFRSPPPPSPPSQTGPSSSNVLRSAAPRAGAAALPPDVLSRVERLKSEGNSCLVKSDYLGAIKAYDEGLKLDRDNVALRTNKAAALNKCGRHDEAVRVCEEAETVAVETGKDHVVKLKIQQRLLEAYRAKGDDAGVVKALTAIEAFTVDVAAKAKVAEELRLLLSKTTAPLPPHPNRKPQQQAVSEEGVLEQGEGGFDIDASKRDKNESATRTTPAAPAPAPRPPSGSRPSFSERSALIKTVSVQIEYCNTLTGQSGAARVSTNDSDAVSQDPERVAVWTERIRRKHAMDEGWNLEDTVVMVDEDSRKEAAGLSGGNAEAGSGREPGKSTNSRRRLDKTVHVRIEYYNTRTGQRGSATVGTNDSDAISTDPEHVRSWTEKIRRKHAIDEGWNLADTVVTVDEEQRQATARGEDRGPLDERVDIRVEYWHTRNGQNGEFTVNTADADVISNDPKRVRAWTERVRADFASQRGWNVEDIELTVEEASIQAARSGNSDSNSRRPTDRPATIKLDFRNSRTWDSSSAEIVTNDPDAISTDPERHRLWVDRIRKKHAWEQGWDLADTIATVDQSDLQAARAAAAAANSVPDAHSDTSTVTSKKVSEFRENLDTTESIARHYLELASGDIELATEIYFEHPPIILASGTDPKLPIKQDLSPTLEMKTMSSMGNLQAQEGRYNEALATYQIAVAGLLRILGPDHESTLNTLKNIGNVQEKQSNYDEAVATYQKVLSGRMRRLGPLHKDTLETTNDIKRVSRLAADVKASASCIDRKIVISEQRSALAAGVLPWSRSRIMIVGEGRVGKTTLLRRLLGDLFNAHEKSTVGVAQSDVDSKYLREQSGVDISNAETLKGWEKVKDNSCDEHVRVVRQEIARRAKSREAEEREREEEQPHDPADLYDDFEAPAIDDECGYYENAEASIPAASISTLHAPNETQTLTSASTLENAKQDVGAQPDFPRKNLEEEKMRELGDDVLLSEAGNLRLSIWDYGGQKIFQSVQHLLVVRRAVYFVVFDMESFRSRREHSFSYLDFWLHTIVIQAQGAPIFLIGTRGDKVANVNVRRQISGALEERYQRLLKGAVEWNGEREKGGLFFFPVDNTSDSPKAINAFADIKARTERRISSDKLPPLLPVSSTNYFIGSLVPYVEDKIPITWLDFADELKKVASGNSGDGEHGAQPFLHSGLFDVDEGTITALSVAEKCKVFKGLATADEKKTRLHVVLTALNALGVVLYFGDSESLRGFVILQPQWLLDQLCFVIRDFHRHRLYCDKRIQKDYPEEWENLTLRGIVSSRIFSLLWVGLSASERNFVSTLMISLGLLVELNEEPRVPRFLAPNIVTAVDDDDDNALARSDGSASDSFGERSTAKEEVVEISSTLGDSPYLPSGFLERVVSFLTPFTTTETISNPSMWTEIPSSSEAKKKGRLIFAFRIKDGQSDAEVRMSSRGRDTLVVSVRPLLITSPKNVRETYRDGAPAASDVACSVGDSNLGWWKLHASNIWSLARDVNEEFFGGRLVLKNSRESELKGQALAFRFSLPADRLRSPSLSAPSDLPSLSPTLVEGDPASYEADEILSFLIKVCGVKIDRARRIHSYLVDDEGWDSLDMLTTKLRDGDELIGELRDKKVCGGGDLEKIKKGLERSSKSTPAAGSKTPFILVVTGGGNLQTTEEAKIIRSVFDTPEDEREVGELPGASAEALEGALSRQRDTLKIVHFAMHGCEVSKSGGLSLDMAASGSSAFVCGPEELSRILKNAGAKLETVVLNICNGVGRGSDDYLVRGKFITGGSKYIIGWATKVEDYTAIHFSEVFYTKLKDGDAVDRAFFNAVRVLRDVYGYQTDLDPTSREDDIKLRERRRQKQISTLRIAGVPKLFKRTGGDSHTYVEMLEESTTAGSAAEEKSLLTAATRGERGAAGNGYVTNDKAGVGRTLSGDFRAMTLPGACDSLLSIGGRLHSLLSSGVGLVSPTAQCSVDHERLEFKKSAALAKAREPIDRDISRYTALYSHCLQANWDDIGKLQQLVDSLRVDELEPRQPQELNGCSPQGLNSDYLYELNLAFRNVDGKIFNGARAVAERLNLTFKAGKNKEMERCNEKARLAYDGDLSRLKDLRRASILCPTIASITEVLRLLVATEGFEILRIKNRFSRDYDVMDSAGYRDVQINVRATGTALVWELQLHLEAIEKLKSSLDANGGKGHENYKLYRMQMERIKQGKF